MMYSFYGEVPFSYHGHFVEGALDVASPADESAELAVAAEWRVACDKKIPEISDLACVPLVWVAAVKKMAQF